MNQIDCWGVPRSIRYMCLSMYYGLDELSLLTFLGQPSRPLRTINTSSACFL